MNKDEIRKIVIEELKDKLQQLNLTENNVEVWEKNPSNEELDKKGLVLDQFATVKDKIVWALKKGAQIVGLVVFLFGPYGTVQFIGEVLVPGTIPDVKELAQITRQGAINIVRNELPHEPAKFVMISQSWTHLDENQYHETLKELQDPSKKKMQDFVRRNDITLVSSSGITDQIYNRLSST